MAAHTTIPSQALTVPVMLIHGLLLLPLAAQADELPDLQAFTGAVEVSDEELAEMRGRFITPRSLMFFGVDMYTGWHTRTGETLRGELNMSVDLSQDLSPSAAQPRPVLSIVRTIEQGQTGVQANRTRGNDHGSLASISGNGLDQVAGVAQAIQVAGDTNRITNDIRMDITARTAGDEPAQNPSLELQTVDVAGTTSVTSGSGAVTAITIDHNTLGIAMIVPGEGTVRQQISGSELLPKGILQQSRITGDLHRIHNLIDIRAELRDAARPISINLDTVLHGLSGLPR